mgnify:CR=1 FL=1
MEMTDNLTIVRAVYSGLSQRQVAATHHVSRNTVSLLVRHAKAQGWFTLEDLQAGQRHLLKGPGEAYRPLPGCDI